MFEKQTPNAARPARKRFESIRQLAIRLDISHTTVTSWVKRNDWPFNRRSPWKESQVAKIQRWAAETLQKRVDATPDDAADAEGVAALRKQKLQQEIRKLFANADQAEAALAKERGGLLDANEVAVEWAAIRRMIGDGVEHLPAKFATLAVAHGLPVEAEAQFREEAAEAFHRVLNHLGDCDSGRAAKVPHGAT